MCFKEWIVLLLGSLYDSELQNEIRSIVDNVNELSGGCMSDRQRYLIYLVAEGCCHLSENEINSALDGILPDNKSERKVLFQAILEIKSTFTGKLMTAKRYPLILILDEHFEVIPWECMPILRRHPVSRVVSLHFLYALFKLHQPHIRNGLSILFREIADNDICYYIINPDGDLPSVEEKLAKFLKIRLPHWVGIVGQKPTEEQLIEALTTKNTFVYCGHGSGCQYMSMEVIQKLKVRPVQMLYGCCSAGLKDHGGIVEMTGDVLQYTIAGSGCTLGMLWSVMSNDTDKMTMVLANTWLPGKPVDINTFEEIKDGSKSQEPELLRAMKEVRDCVGLFSNGAAFIARGIPIVLVCFTYVFYFSCNRGM
ncbi:hypothetical protein AAG570_006354 [Ranatra chinensis]|uniref:separase n=1 Tax=Ranatra chinensis TaxID=642074 RepID=A0ABD0YTQ9_9HEMI